MKYILCKIRIKRESEDHINTMILVIMRFSDFFFSILSGFWEAYFNILPCGLPGVLVAVRLHMHADFRL